MLANERWPVHDRVDPAALPRLFHAARFHAKKVLSVATDNAERPPSCSPLEEDSGPVLYRSLAMDDEDESPYGERLPSGLGAKDAFSPLCREDVPDGLVEEARAVLA